VAWVTPEPSSLTNLLPNPRGGKEVGLKVFYLSCIRWKNSHRDNPSIIQKNCWGDELKRTRKKIKQNKDAPLESKAHHTDFA